MEALVEIPTKVAIEEEHVYNEPLIPVTSLLEHLTDLRKQIIKGLTVFILFFIVVFSTINIWFPFITRGHSLVILGPLEVVKFYMTISTTLAFGLAMPFLVHFLWSFIKPGLKKRKVDFRPLCTNHVSSIFSRSCFWLFCRKPT